jgi:hypothetical protein
MAAPILQKGGTLDSERKSYENKQNALAYFNLANKGT